ncbi:hypothetical protein [Zavarzinia compransoris]|uniref:Nudix hydrolase domain-containing protein n=1 Tax=Zavarzinia compransoris TaxID=1264899 RepID=A0A317EFC1_9PROT|nr:hypothetical protein [Zavarzinia compransoris]PWR23875.1 hypothetical protein DKG75_04805 [Zavarzinia compransoris]TDP48116.1 hypothetical protein DES42_102418 [Zavarzinia compransoris]
MPKFFIEDSEYLLRIYRDEICLPYPFVTSEQRLPYVLCFGDEVGQARARLDRQAWLPSEEICRATAEAYVQWLGASGAVPEPLATNVRLSDIADDGTLILQPVRYEDYARTNLVMDWPAGPSLREREKGRLAPLRESEFANPMGVSILAVNTLGEVPLQIRSQSIAVRPGMICSTASGGLDIGDIPSASSCMAEWRLMRELEEEMGTGLAGRLGAPQVLGLARELSRGGQPELFLVAEGDFSRDDVLRSIRATAMWETHDIIFLQFPRRNAGFDLSGAAQAMDAFDRAYGTRVAQPLRAHVSLWFRFLARSGLLIGPGQ